MTKRFCDRCVKEIPKLPESCSFVLSEGETDTIVARTWRVSVVVAPDRDLCLDCRKQIVAAGKAALAG